MKKDELLKLIKNNELEYKGDYHNIKHLFLPETDSEHLVVVFSGFHGGEVSKKPPVYNYINTLENIKINKLFIMDNIDNTPVYYYGINGTGTYLHDTSNLIHYYTNKLKVKNSNVITTGSSKGGTGSLLVGLYSEVGHIISAANQLYVGSYLNSLPKVRELMFNKIFGNNNDINVEKLNEIFKKYILVNSTQSNLYFHAGTRDSHYIKHMKPMLEHFDNENIYYELDLKNYIGHSSVIYFYPEYLKRKINEILNLPSIKKPNVTRENDKINIQVKVSYNRPSTHYYEVTLILKNGEKMISSYKKELLHSFSVAAKEIKNIYINLKEYDIIRDTKLFNFDEVNDKLDVLKRKNLISDQWITKQGEVMINNNMMRTKKLSYSSLNNYVITGSASVAYYKGDNFVKYERITGKVSELPFYIGKVSEADNIILSFNKKWLGKMQLKTL